MQLKCLFCCCIVSAYAFIPQFMQIINQRLQIHIDLVSRCVSLGISKDNIKFGAFIHLHGGILYSANTTGHILYDILVLLNGLKPSLAKPSRMLRESRANQSCFLSNSFHTIESAGCLRVLSPSSHPSLCHLICLAISFDVNNRCNLGFIGKYRKTF
jgi:hypothetical protein